jgi:hypothetical protein
MGALKQRWASRGLEVIQGAMNNDPRIPDFVRSFSGGLFPVGTAPDGEARGFMQISIMQQTAYLPWFAVVDRKGMIREQHFGDESLFQGDEVGKMAQVLDKYLAERAGAPAATPKKR